MTENITFWETFKPFLTDKTINTFRITLIEEERVISQDHLTTKTFNEYFISIPIRNLSKNQEHESFDSSEEGTVSSTIKKYRNHPNIKLIKTKNKAETFRFCEKNTDEIKKFIEILHPEKSSQKFDMSTNVLKKMQLFSHITSAIASML